MDAMEILHNMPPAMREAYVAELGRSYAATRVKLVVNKAKADYANGRGPSDSERREGEQIVDEILGIEELIELAIDVSPNTPLPFEADPDLAG